MICQRCAKDRAEIHTCSPSQLVRNLEQHLDELLTALEPFADIQHYSLAPDGAGFAMRSNGDAVTYGHIRAAKSAIEKVKP